MDSKKQLIQIFNSYDIEYWTSGKNVTGESINVQCPFCNDHSNHCGVFLDSLVFHCWRCSTSGPFVWLLQRLTGLSQEDCERVLKSSDVNFKSSTLDQIEQLTGQEEIKQVGEHKVIEIPFPEYAVPVTSKYTSPVLKNYLRRRNLDKQTLIDNNCQVCEVGRYMHRLIIPVYFEGKLVSYQAADMTGKGDVKYDTAPGDINDYLYGYDDITSVMLIVEGMLDRWVAGPISCATFGTSLTDRQRTLIEAKELDWLVFCWDRDAYFKAKKEAKYFELFIDKVLVLPLPYGEDPDSLGEEKFFKILNNFLELGV